MNKENIIHLGGKGRKGPNRQTNINKLIKQLNPREEFLTVDQMRALDVHPLLARIPSLNDREESILRASLGRFGALHSITITGNRLLDGRGRVAFAIAQKRPLRALILDADEDDQKSLVLSMALGRRNVTDCQKAMVGAEMVIAEGEKLSRREAAKLVGVSAPYVCKAVDIIGAGDANVITAVKRGKISLKRAHRELREKQAIEKNRQKAARHPAGLVELRFGSFQQRTRDIADNSIDAIITDPLYDLKFQHDWEDLGRLSERTLKPGGILVIMVGGATSDEIIIAVTSQAASLRKFWNFTAPIHGETSSHPGRNVRSEKRDYLVYFKTSKGVNKPLTINDMGHDLLPPIGSNLLYSPFGQQDEAFMPFVEWYTKPGDLVLDPFAGGGAVPSACERLGRRCIACEYVRGIFDGIVGRFFGAERVAASAKDTWGQFSLPAGPKSG